MSRPLRARELKHFRNILHSHYLKSRPLRARELKLFDDVSPKKNKSSRPLRARELKRIQKPCLRIKRIVAPPTGA